MVSSVVVAFNEGKDFSSPVGTGLHRSLHLDHDLDESFNLVHKSSIGMRRVPEQGRRKNSRSGS